MHNIQPREIEVYETPNGQTPFSEWFASIQDTRTQTRIRGRLDRLENGNYGDCQSVGSGVFELRLHFGPGYRIYFGEVDRTIVLLLCGGDKSTQTRDIQRARTYRLEYNRTYAMDVRLDYVPQGPRALRAFMSGWARKPKPSIPTAF